MDYWKQATKEYYDWVGGNAAGYSFSGEEYARKFLGKEALQFSNLVGNGIVLDIGSGLGRQASFLRKFGLNPICLDFSFVMAQECKKKGLRNVVCDMEKLPFPDESIRGVWAYNSLLNLRKGNLRNALREIKRVLEPQGIAFIGMKEGRYDNFQEDRRDYKKERWVALYSPDELIRRLEDFLKIESFDRKRLNDMPMLHYFCRKK